MKGLRKGVVAGDSKAFPAKGLRRFVINEVGILQSITGKGGFMKSVIKSFGMVMLLSCLIHVSAAYAGVPNVFSPGTTAQSGQVNDNFNFVNYGNIVVKANGVEIGPLLTCDGTGITFLTQQGYIVTVTSQGSVTNIDDFLPELVYTTSNCTGTAYADTNLLNGQVFLNTVSGGTLFYVSKTAVPTTISMLSVMDSNGMCVAVSGNGLYLPVAPNDPSVTGVSLDGFTPPVTIERR